MIGKCLACLTLSASQDTVDLLNQASFLIQLILNTDSEKHIKEFTLNPRERILRCLLLRSSINSFESIAFSAYGSQNIYSEYRTYQLISQAEVRNYDTEIR